MVKKVPVQDHQRMAMQVAFLRVLYVTGALSIALVAPKLTRLLLDPDAGKTGRKAFYARIALARNRLKQRGLLKEVDGRLYLTDKGHAHIERILMHEYKIPEPIRWDGKWRVLVFDIREQRRRVRAQLRALLQSSGFVRLQDSVWVYPYPCDEFISLVRAHLASGVGELRLLVAEALESDRTLRDHFGLLL